MSPGIAFAFAAAGCGSLWLRSSSTLATWLSCAPTRRVYRMLLGMRAGFAAVLALAACGKDSAPPDVTFSSDPHGCPAAPAICAEVGVAGDDLVVTARNLPDGATVSPTRIPIGGVLHKLTIRQAIGA